MREAPSSGRRRTPRCSAGPSSRSPQQAGDDGRLFGSVTAQDIADAIREARGIKVDKRKIHLDGADPHIGTYMVVVEVADDVTATIKTMVVAQK